MDENQLITCKASDLRSAILDASDAAVKRVLRQIKSLQVTGYYSTVRFQAYRTQIDPGPPIQWRYTVPKGMRTAFSYANQQNPASGGFPATFGQATLRQTNLTEAQKTRAGETFRILGLGMYLSTQSDSAIAEAVLQRAAMTLSMDAGSVWQFGPLDFVPAQAGLSGTGTTRLMVPDIQSRTATLSKLENGRQQRDNFFAFPAESPLIWSAAGNPDSQLTLQIELPEDIVFDVTERAAGAGIAPYVPPVAPASPTDTTLPAEAFSFADFTFRAIGYSLSDPSV